MKKLFGLALGLSLIAAAAQEIPNGDFSRGTAGWNLVAQGEVKAAAEVVKDGFDGKPALKVVVSEAPEASWWMLRLCSLPEVKLESGVTYVLSFWARCEGPSRSVETGWGANRQKIASRQKFKVVEEWQEFLYPFTVDASTGDAYLVFDNLAAPEAV